MKVFGYCSLARSLIWSDLYIGVTLPLDIEVGLGQTNQDLNDVANWGSLA